MANVGDVKTEQQIRDEKFQEFQDVKQGAQNLSFLAEDMKGWYTSLVMAVNDMNGTQIAPGPMTSYIPRKNYYQLLHEDVRGLLGEQATLIEVTLNYVALGKGIAGFLGAAVRLGYRDSVDADRETFTYNTLEEVCDNVSAEDIATVNKLFKSHGKAFGACKANVDSFLVQACSNLIRMTHHWSSEAHKEYTSMIKVMGLQEIIADDQLRPLVYLSVHPCPLSVLEEKRTQERKDADSVLIETVNKRKDATPAGYGAASACLAAVNDMLSEEFSAVGYWDTVGKVAADKIAILEEKKADVPNRLYEEVTEAKACHTGVARLRESIDKFAEDVKPVLTDPAAHCVLANAFGKEKEVVDLVPHTGVMCLLTAYIYAKVRGTLAKSPALKKYRNEHAVRVMKAQEVLDSFEDTGKFSSILAAI